ncbi:hypothetical protein MFRU_004g01920 [Monilinia fructicola]|nr:hypothetical protein MFRU_004g01920 [Monilinia fructicola]
MPTQTLEYRYLNEAQLKAFLIKLFPVQSSKIKVSLFIAEFIMLLGRRRRFLLDLKLTLMPD